MSDILTAEDGASSAFAEGRPRASAITFRAPTAEDGAAVWDLIAASPPLDRNSRYANLLQCSHFAATCVLAERDGRAAGWVSAYRPPEEPETLFVWQIAVAESARGEGLGRALLAALLRRAACTGVTQIKTTISPDNAASHALFHALARELDAPLQVMPWLRREAHFAGRHDDEDLVAIGPISLRA